MNHIDSVIWGNLYIIIDIFYASKDDTVLRCSVVYYFNRFFYYVTMNLMWNGITVDNGNANFRCKNTNSRVKSASCILDEVQKYESCRFFVYI